MGWAAVSCRETGGGLRPDEPQRPETGAGEGHWAMPTVAQCAGLHTCFGSGFYGAARPAWKSMCVVVRLWSTCGPQYKAPVPVDNVWGWGQRIQAQKAPALGTACLPPSALSQRLCPPHAYTMHILKISADAGAGVAANILPGSGEGVWHLLHRCMTNACAVSSCLTSSAACCAARPALIHTRALGVLRSPAVSRELVYAFAPALVAAAPAEAVDFLIAEVRSEKLHFIYAHYPLCTAGAVKLPHPVFSRSRTYAHSADRYLPELFPFAPAATAPAAGPPAVGSGARTVRRGGRPPARPPSGAAVRGVRHRAAGGHGQVGGGNASTCRHTCPCALYGVSACLCLATVCVVARGIPAPERQQLPGHLQLCCGARGPACVSQSPSTYMAPRIQHCAAASVRPPATWLRPNLPLPH